MIKQSQNIEPSTSKDAKSAEQKAQPSTVTEEVRYAHQRPKDFVSFVPKKNSASFEKVLGFGPLVVPDKFELTDSHREALRSKPIDTIGTDISNTRRVWDKIKSSVAAPFKAVGRWLDRAAEAIGVPEKWRGAFKATSGAGIGLVSAIAGYALTKAVKKPIGMLRSGINYLRHGTTAAVASRLPASVTTRWATARAVGTQAFGALTRVPVVGGLAKVVGKIPVKHPAFIAVATVGYVAYQATAFTFRHTEIDEKIVAKVKGTRVFQGAASGVSTIAKWLSPVTKPVANRISNLYHSIRGTEPAATEESVKSSGESSAIQTKTEELTPTPEINYPDLIMPIPKTEPNNTPDTSPKSEMFSELSFNKPKQVGS